MKYLVMTDIHGSRNSAEILKEKFERSGADKILLLGDLLYFGPRNTMLDDYEPKSVIDILNSFADKIVAVRGNCDAEVDQMVLDFELNESVVIELQDRSYFCTHGHHISHEAPGKLAKGTVVLYGHFHKTRVTEIDGVTYFNIASITYPKGDSVKCYGILDESGISVFDLDDNLIIKK